MKLPSEEWSGRYSCLGFTSVVGVRDFSQAHSSACRIVDAGTQSWLNTHTCCPPDLVVSVQPITSHSPRKSARSAAHRYASFGSSKSKRLLPGALTSKS